MDLEHVCHFKKVKRLGLKQKDIFNELQISSVVEVKQEIIDGDWTQQYVRKKVKKSQLDFMGFEGDSIKEMSKQQFEIFLQKKKEFEQNLITQPKYQIIIATVGSGCTRLIRDLNIKHVLIDEATQVKEHESYLASINAERIVLIGD